MCIQECVTNEIIRSIHQQCGQHRRCEEFVEKKILNKITSGQEQSAVRDEVEKSLTWKC